MYIKQLVPKHAGIDYYNTKCQELAEENKDNKYGQMFLDIQISSLDKIFRPFSAWEKELQSMNLKTIPEDSSLKTAGIFVADCNAHYLLKDLTDYEDCRNGTWYFGVCDNATQFLAYYNALLADGSLSKKDIYFLSMMPIIREKNGDWRWHKWGPYIGVQQITAEHIGDEKDIDMVYCFSIRQVLPVN